MGAPEVIFLAVVVGLPCLVVWALVARHRRRNARRYVEALGRVAEGTLTAEDDLFWRDQEWKP